MTGKIRFFALVTIVSILLVACGGGGGGGTSAPPTSAEVTFSLTGMPAGVKLGILDISINLPAGIKPSVPPDIDGFVTGSILLNNNASSLYTPFALYSPTPSNTVKITLGNTSNGLGISNEANLITLKLSIDSSADYSKLNNLTKDIKVYDLGGYNRNNPGTNVDSLRIVSFDGDYAIAGNIYKVEIVPTPVFSYEAKASENIGDVVKNLVNQINAQGSYEASVDPNNSAVINITKGAGLADINLTAPSTLLTNANTSISVVFK